MSACFLTFEAIFHTKFGEELYVVGNHPSIGAWECQKGLPMQTNKHDYPSWRGCHRVTLPQPTRQFRMNYPLEFKICIMEGHTFKRWQENYPVDRNRQYKTDSRYVKLKVLDNNIELMVEKKYRVVSSDEVLAGEFIPAHKYDYQKDSENDSNSSSGGEFQEAEPSRSKPVHKIQEFVNAFQGSLELGIRTTHHPYMKHYTYKPPIPVKHSNQTYLAWHFFPQGFPVPERSLRVECLSVELAEGPADSQEQLAKHILQRIRSQRTKSFPAVVLHGMEFALMPRNLRMLVGDTAQLAIVLEVASVDRLLLQTHDSEQVLHVIESLFFTECLMFTDYSVLQQFLMILERLLLQFNIKGVGLSEFVIISDFRPFYVRVVASNQDADHRLHRKWEVECPDIVQLPIFQVSEETATNTHKSIMESFEKVLSARMIVFSFGQHQSLDVLLNYREQLNHLSHNNLIYVFTPGSLSDYAQIISHLPLVVFISATYMQVHYKDQRHHLMPPSRRGQRIFPREFMDLLKSTVSYTPGCAMHIRNNLIYLRLEENSRLALETFQQLLTKVEALVRHFNESNHESIIITRLNTATAEVRQFYQTKMFLTNLIFKSSSTTIGFLALFMINRFQNFKYFRQLQHVLEVQMSLSSKVDFFGYVVTSIKTKRADVLNEADLLTMLKEMIKCEIEENKRDPHRNYSTRSPVFSFKHVSF